MARVLRVAVAIQHTLGLLQKARRCIARPYDRLRRLADHRVAAIARAVIPHDLDTGLRLAERYAETGTGQLVGTGELDRKSVVEGKRVAVRVDHGGSRIIKKQK